MLDCYQSMADCADEYKYVKPFLMIPMLLILKKEDTRLLKEYCRREKNSLRTAANFLRSDNQIIILTGPNMAGKSVYLRQVGLIVLLHRSVRLFRQKKHASVWWIEYLRVSAQAIIFPPEKVHFWLKCRKQQYILNNATGKSLILLDEIGQRYKYIRRYFDCVGNYRISCMKIRI